MRPRWRLIIDGACEGAWNMALDRSIQLARDAGLAPPTLRLYGWARPTVSIGRFQSAGDADLVACRELGLDVVRRHTGGRGVLHDGEVTYSCVASVADGVPRGVAASYRHLCAAIVESYKELGVDASLVSRNPRGRGGAACYLHATPADVSLGKAKLSGSAQVWHRDTVLQHGSFVISRDVAAEARVFMLTDRQRDRLEEQTGTLAALGLEKADVDTVMRAVVEAWQRALGVRLVPGEITEWERSSAEELQNSARVTDFAREGLSEP